MKAEDLIRQYLPQIKIMQLATSANNQPYACTVHYYSDDRFNLYWRSTLARRHSQEISQNPKVAATILVHENTPEEKYVIGITVVGTVELLGQKIDPTIGDAYIKKLALTPQLLQDIEAGKDPHNFYALKPNKIVLFDSKNFPKDPRQEWNVSS